MPRFMISDIYVSGDTLNITRVNRAHMGTYLCIADNGVPPQANQTFNLEVYCKSVVFASCYSSNLIEFLENHISNSDCDFFSWATNQFSYYSVPPLIRISNQMVGVTNGSTAVLECITEAFPEPLRYVPFTLDYLHFIDSRGVLQ